MNKVTTINLGGRAYQLEEEGFEALHSYLEEAKARLATDPGQEEILADLETAFAEKCDKLLHSHKTVITTSEIKEIIREMGPVEAEGTAENTETKATHTAHAPRHFYLIREGAVLAGVCTGIATFFEIDPIIPRIAFVALTIFTGGAWILAYIALAILIPYADTEEAKAAARGEPFTAQDIVDRTKERIEESVKRFTDDWHTRYSGTHEWHRRTHELRRQARAWKHAQRQYHPNPVLGLLSGALGLLWIFALLSLITTGAIFGWVVPSAIPLWVAVILLFIAYHAVTGPLKGARYANTWGRYQYSAWDGLVDGLTVLFLIIAGVWAYLHIPEVSVFVHHPVEVSRQAIHWIQAQLH